MAIKKVILATCIIGCSLISKSQTSKPIEKCGGECCKDKKSSNISVSKNKANSPMDVVVKKKVVACKLTSPEMQKRKQEVLAVLKSKVLARQDLANGYKYKFAGSDDLLDQVITFIKSERACCDFFTFDLSVSDNQSYLWLSITGQDGAKDFIKTEMDL
jgi:hypothetical protein